MKKVLVWGLAAAALLAAQVCFGAWNAEWTHRARIGLNTADDGLPIKTAVDSAPLLIRLHSGNFSFVDAKPDGSDLRFIAADDKTPLKYHIEKFDGLNELALVWVQVPKVSPATKADFIWVYYGNPKAVAGDEPKASYDSAQALVYHFGEKETLPQDSTANANHAARSTAKPSGAGLIGGGVGFDGNAEITIAGSPSLKQGPGGMTVSMWIKPTDLAHNASLYAQRDGSQTLGLGLRGDKLIAQSGSTTTQPAGTLAAATWQHVALVVKDGLTLYLNGAEIAHVDASSTAIGGDLSIGRGFVGEIDELEVATTARSPDWIKFAAGSQGQDQKLVAYATAEGGTEEGGTSYLKILLGALTPDGWVVVGILMVMLMISVVVMIAKAALISGTLRANEKFKGQFAGLFGGIDPTPAEVRDPGAALAGQTEHRNSSLYRLFAAGVDELHSRFDSYAKAGRAPSLSNQSINAIRATIDARLVRELQRLNAQMVLLTIAIAGGPFLGLLGTVVGVMITFAAIAAAGDVNVNAIAPGIAAALIATVAGLAVAIPALFGYNYLTSKIKDVSSDMQVFVDEFITKIAENYST